ncbi:MAG: zinc-binding dehydrogenase [Thiohalocapsa sp.]
MRQQIGAVGGKSAARIVCRDPGETDFAAHRGNLRQSRNRRQQFFRTPPSAPRLRPGPALLKGRSARPPIRRSARASGREIQPRQKERGHPASTSRNLAELLRWWEGGKLKPLIAKTLPLAEAVAALEALLSRRYAGKIVLET